MHLYIGDVRAYNWLNTIGAFIMIVTNFLYYKSKKDATSLYARQLVGASSKVHKVFGAVVRVILYILEMGFASLLVDKTSHINIQFGDIFNTGANYYGLLTFLPVYMTLFSLILLINPLKQLDIMTMGLPVYLFFVKLGCYCEGCCWGIPWEQGPYNYNEHHPGNQVPVQLLEALCAVIILIVLLIYRRKAKAGTVYPLYIILYSVTRFPIEFLSASHEAIAGPFNTYHLLCIAGVLYGILILAIVKKYGDRITAFFDSLPEPFIKMKAKIKENERFKLLEEKVKKVAPLKKGKAKLKK